MLLLFVSPLTMQSMPPSPFVCVCVSIHNLDKIGCHIPKRVQGFFGIKTPTKLYHCRVLYTTFIFLNVDYECSASFPKSKSLTSFFFFFFFFVPVI